MIIVAGHLEVAPENRAEYLSACRAVVEQARATPGCLDFSLAPDPIEPGRITILERWASSEDVDRFRGAAPTDPGGPDAAMIQGADVVQYEVRTQHDL